MITTTDITTWGGLVGAAIAIILAIWNKFGIKALSIKTDGMLEYRDRANRSEGTVDEQHRQEDRADQKEKNNAER